MRRPINFYEIDELLLSLPIDFDIKLYVYLNKRRGNKPSFKNLQGDSI